MNHIPLLKIDDQRMISYVGELYLYHSWEKLPKMVILPKINYLFPLILNEASIICFESLDSNISKFLWKNKLSQISLKTLKQNGTLERPNSYHYFSSNRSLYVSKWIKPGMLDTPQQDLEQSFSGKVKVSNLPFISSNIKHFNSFTFFLIITNSVMNQDHE